MVVAVWAAGLACRSLDAKMLPPPLHTKNSTNMSKNITIRCKNTGRTHKVPIGFNLEEVYEMLDLNMPYGPTSAKVNNKVEGLHFTFFTDKDVEFLDITSSSGLRTYTRSLFFVLYKAVRDIYGPSARLRIETPVSNGYYCRLITGSNDGVVSQMVVDQLKQRMAQIVAADIPFHRITCPTEQAVARFRADGLESKAKLLESVGKLYTTYYTLDDTADYFYGSLLIKTSQIYLFDLALYGDGLLLRIPDPENPSQLRPMVEQPKMFEDVSWHEPRCCVRVRDEEGTFGAGAEGAHGLCCGRDGRSLCLELADSCDGGERVARQLVVPARGHRLLGGDALPACARSPDTASAPSCRAGGGAAEPFLEDRHDGARGDAAQHP